MGLCCMLINALNVNSDNSKISELRREHNLVLSNNDSELFYARKKMIFIFNVSALAYWTMALFFYYNILFWRPVPVLSSCEIISDFAGKYFSEEQLPLYCLHTWSATQLTLKSYLIRFREIIKLFKSTIPCVWNTS